MDDRRMGAAQTRLNRVSERAQDFASDAGEQLSHYGERMGPYMEQAKRFVQDRPLQAIALTIGLGFLLGKLLGGRD